MFRRDSPCFLTYYWSPSNALFLYCLDLFCAYAILFVALMVNSGRSCVPFCQFLTRIGERFKLMFSIFSECLRITTLEGHAATRDGKHAKITLSGTTTTWFPSIFNFIPTCCLWHAYTDMPCSFGPGMSIYTDMPSDIVRRPCFFPQYLHWTLSVLFVTWLYRYAM